MALKEVDARLNALATTIQTNNQAYEAIADAYIELLLCLKANLPDMPKNFSLSQRLGKQALKAIESTCNFANNIASGSEVPLLAPITGKAMIINDDAHSIIRGKLSHYDAYSIALQLCKDKNWTLTFSKSVKEAPKNFTQNLKSAIQRNNIGAIKLSQLEAMEPKLFRIILQSNLISQCDSKSAKIIGSFVKTDTRVTALALQKAVIQLISLRQILTAMSSNASLIRASMPTNTVFHKKDLALIMSNKSILYFSLNFSRHENHVANQIVTWNNSNIRQYRLAQQQTSVNNTNGTTTAPAPAPK